MKVLETKLIELIPFDYWTDLFDWNKDYFNKFEFRFNRENVQKEKQQVSREFLE